jgi:hypothetical protein
MEVKNQGTRRGAELLKPLVSAPSNVSDTSNPQTLQILTQISKTPYF